MAATSPGNNFTPLTERDWQILLRRIDDGQCTIFLGAEAAFGNVPTKSQISRELAAEYNYPLDDVDNLARVTQYIATTVNPLEPKEKIRERIKGVIAPDFTNRDNPYRKLAELPFSIFITTGFDSFLVPALSAARRNPRSEICRWHPNLSELPSVLEAGFTPEVPNPLVFHMYGNAEKCESLVVTEDDFMDFLVNTSRELAPKPIPEKIQAAFAFHSLLFFGYRLEDLEFRVLVRRMLAQLSRNGNKSHISVQLINVVEDLPDARKQQLTLLQDYLSSYCLGAPLFIKTCWGSAGLFTSELHRRWEEKHAR